MNKNQIKAELRRSACEDEEPWLQVEFDAFKAADQFVFDNQHILNKSYDYQRTFFLLVAESL